MYKNKTGLLDSPWDLERHRQDDEKKKKIVYIAKHYVSLKEVRR